ncbi:MAG: HD domain-containing phosphohydrolase [Acutalibacteraceae bacterium]|nr:HD domain-containing phosphohydrolase [Acutalibacteraceae bacterium]
MQRENNILVLNSKDNVNTLALVSVSENSIPEELNGESGFHIYHVRMLTELILTQLCETGCCSLSKEQINAISIASSLHDIGKSKIPKSILDFPGKLSPLEYDIVKKHSIFGEEIIKNSDFSLIGTEIQKYASEIARYHHERYDGTGYPDGLKGDEIPLSAQVVSLADSYDALTSNRSYKDAFSQDVAIQMISSGMCGIFNEKLIDALLRVVNHSSLVSLREKLYKTGSVVSENVGFTPARVLCIGNTEYLTKQFIDDTFPNSKVTVVGNTVLGSADKLKLFRIKKPSIKAIFETYDFDVVVYFSGDLTYHTTEKNDAEELREVLEFSKETNKDIKILYLSSLDSSFQNATDRSILCSAKEKLCDFYAKSYSLDIKTVQIPYLYSGVYSKDYLYNIFEKVHNKKMVVLDEKPASKMHFISLSDLSKLISRIIDNWKCQSGILSVGDDFDIKFSDFSEKIAEINADAKFDFTATKESEIIQLNNKGLRNEYGWFARISILEDLEEEYEKYLISKHEKTLTLWQKIKKWIEDHSLLVKIAELILLFLVTELLLYFTDSAVIFSIVDFRMAYIVIMATVHGLSFGMSAAALSSISWLVAKVSSGTNLLTIFYEPTNWLAFVFFFLVGALCGYIKLRKDDTIRFVGEQNKLLEDKLIFTREIYEDTYKEKRDLKKQIIGSKDSFGKIFDITRKLDTVEPQRLYLRIMETFEEILENKNITVYSVNKQSTFGRLEVASRDIIDTVPRSISTETYREVIEKISTGEIFRNTDLSGEYPMYAAGVYRGDELVLLIFLWRADIEQRSLYYVNLFKILRDLVQMSLLRAFDYSQAVYEKQYIANTHIMNIDAFNEVFNNYVALAEKKVSSFVMLEIHSNGHSYEEIDKMLAGKVRVNDVIGMSEDGNIRLLLSGATEKDLPFILPRFKGIDVEVKTQ